MARTTRSVPRVSEIQIHRLVMLLGGMVAALPLVRAQATFLWDAGHSNDNMTVAANWNPDGAPAPGTLTNYSFNISGTQTPIANGTTPWEVNNIIFGSSAGATTISSSTTYLKLAATGITQSDGTGHTISAPIELQSAGTLVSGAGSGAITLSGNITGTGGFTKNISGNLNLTGSGANTFTGVTTIEAGTLYLNKSANNIVAVAGNIVIGDGTGTDTVRTNRSGAIASTSQITFASAGSPVLNLNSFNQSIGSLNSTNTGANITLGSATLTVGNDNLSTTYAGFIDGTGSLTKVGSGTLTLNSTTSSFTGQLHVANGTVSFNNLANSGTDSAIGQNITIRLGNGTETGALQYTGGAVTSNRGLDLRGHAVLDASNTTGALVLSNTVVSGDASVKTFTLTGNSDATYINSLSGIISENSTTNTTSLIKEGTGTWAVTGTNTFTGTTTINQGILQIDDESSLGSNPGSLNAAQLKLNGGTLQSTANFSINDSNRGITIDSNGGTFLTDASINLTVSNIITGGGTLTKTGTGNVIINGSSANTHTGAVVVSAGNLQIDKSVANGAIGDSAAVTVSTGARLNFNNGQAETIGSLAGAGKVDNINATAMTLTLGGDGTSTTFSGELQDTSGNLSLTKTGAGTLTLSGANTYVGVTTLGAGTISVGTIGNGSVASGNLGSATNAAANIVFDGGTLEYTGSTASSDRNFTINSGKTATINVTTGATALTLTGNSTATSGSLNKIGDGTLALDGANLYTGGTTVTTGTLRLGHTAALGSAGAALTLSGGSVNLATDSSVNAYNTTLTTSSTITANRATTGSGITHTLGTLGLGAQTLTLNSGSNVNSNTDYGVTFGVTTLSGNAVFDVANNGSGVGTLTLGAIGDSGGGRSIVKQGAGVLLINGASTFSGGTTVTAGSVRYGIDNALSTAGTVNVGASGTLDLGSFNASIGALTGSGTVDLTGNSVNKTLTITETGSNTFSGIIKDTGASSTLALTKAGAGTLTLSGANAYEGTTTVNAGTLRFGVDNTLPTAGTVNVGASGTLDLGSFNGSIGALTGSGTVDLTGSSVNKTLTITETGSNTFSGIIQNTGSSSTLGVTKQGAGSLTLSGPNTYDGLTTVSNGTLTLSGNNAGAAGGVTLTAGTLNLGHVNAAGAGTLTLNGGTLDNSSGGSLTLATNNIQTWGGDFAFTGTNDLNLGTGNVSLLATRTITVNAGVLTVGGVIDDGASTFGLTKAGAGTLTLANANTYGGTTTVNSGTLRFGVDNTLPAAGTVNVGASGTLDLGSFNGSIGALTGSGTVDLTGSSVNKTLTITETGSNIFSGIIQNTGSSSTLGVTKQGAGSLTLSGPNTYDGLTTVSNGTLTLSGNNAGASGGVSLTAGTLNLGHVNAAGTGTLSLNGGTLDNSSGGALTLATNNAQSWGGKFQLYGDEQS